VSELIPVRMINEVTYCPRLFALEHMNGEWADSGDTLRGQTVHRRVDRPSRVKLPEPDALEEDAPEVVRSVHLGDPGLGVVAKCDLVVVEGDAVVPCDFKVGRVPDTPEGAWLPERVQVCAQGLLLRAHGYRCDEGRLYFAGSKRNVRVPFTDELIAQTLGAIDEATRLIASGVLPPPLVDSPKCHRCSLVGICLPDETHLLTSEGGTVRPLAPAREDGLPLYIEARGGKLSRVGGELVVKVDGEVVERARLEETSRVAVRGAVSVTTPALQALAERGVPLTVHGWSGAVEGVFVPSSGHNVMGRIAQHRVAADKDRSLAIARRLIQGKILNQRTLLRRNGDAPARALELLDHHAAEAAGAPSAEVLMGLEGIAARTYFEHFGTMFRERALAAGFEVDGRNRRPPKDPINAMLSLAYAFLAREATTVLVSVGLDAWVGFLHQPRAGRPALALDLMEEFRPILADSAVLTAVNTGVVGADDFERHHVGCSLKDGARKQFIRVFERRLAEEITHPAFGTRMSYRRILEVQARLMGRVAMGELASYTPFRVR
jgi:CRISPR-associated endonuclease Cas1/CRISPR-associated protein Cas4